MTETDTEIRKLSNVVDAIVDVIRPIMAGRDPAIQGAIIARLLALWIGGYQFPKEGRFALRADLAENLVVSAFKYLAIADAAKEASSRAPLH